MKVGEYLPKTFVSIAVKRKRSMTRAIKFRAWDPEKKVMYYNQFCIGSNGTPRKMEVSREYIDWRNENWILLQFTGLLDRNSVEIFEGDIVTKNEYPFIDGNVKPYIAFIIWDAPCFCFELKLLDKKRRGISDGVVQILEDSENFEIIGNLYEHPHLLESEPI